MAIQDNDLLLVNRGQQSNRATVKQLKDYIAGTQEEDDTPGFIFTGATLPVTYDEFTVSPREDIVNFENINLVQFTLPVQVSKLYRDNIIFLMDRATGSTGTYKILSVNTSNASITVDFLCGAGDFRIRKDHPISFTQLNPADIAEQVELGNTKIYVGSTAPLSSEQGTLWWHPVENELYIRELSRWENVNQNYYNKTDSNDRYLSTLSNTESTVYERSCEGSISFNNKAYSTPTSSGDSTATLTTKGYVDNAIQQSGSDAPPERLDPLQTKSVLEFGAISNEGGQSGSSSSPGHWDYDGFIAINTVAFQKAISWVCGILNYDANGNEIINYDTPIWTNRALYVPAGRYRMNRIDTLQFQGYNCNANIYGDGDSSIIEGMDSSADSDGFSGSGLWKFKPMQTQFTIQLRNLQFSPGTDKVITYALEIAYLGGVRWKLNGLNPNDLNYFNSSGWQGWNNPSTRGGGGGGADRNTVTLENITVSRWSKKSPNENTTTTFENGIAILNAKRPLINNVTIWLYKQYTVKNYGIVRNGKDEPILDANDNIQFNYNEYAQLNNYVGEGSKTIGLNLDGCYKPTVLNGYINGQCQIGLSCFTGTETDDKDERSEGCLIQNMTITGSYYNICIRTSPKTVSGDSRPIDISKMQRHPEITVKDCHLSGKGICAYFIGVKYLDVRNNLIFMDGKHGVQTVLNNPHTDVPDKVQAIDIRLDACSYVQLEGNKYASGGAEEIKRVHVFANGSNNVTCRPGALDAPLNISSNDCPQWWFRSGGDYADCNKITVDINRTARKDYYNNYGKDTPKVSFGSGTGDYLFVYRNNTIESLENPNA